ncbi:MAG: DUF6049 family protein [Acidimicrobiia bacterium]
MTRRRAIVGVVATAVLLAVPLAGPHPASAAPVRSAAGSQEAPPGGQEAPAAGLELVDQTTWHSEEDTFEVGIRATGAPPGATVHLAVHNRLVSRSAFNQSLMGVMGGTAHETPPELLAGLPPGPDGAVTLRLPVGEGGAGLTEPGLYPVSVVVAASDGATFATLVTHLALLPPREWYPPLSVAVLLDVSSPPTLRPDGSTDLAPETLARAEERAAVLRGAAGVPVTLAPRPETIDGLTRLGDDRGAAIVAGLVPDPGQQVLARPYTEIDLAALARVGLLGEANHHAEAGADVVREHLGVEPLGGVWLSGPTLGAEAAQVLMDVRIGRAIVPPSAFDQEPDGGGRVPQVPVRLGEDGPRALVVDPRLGTRMSNGGVLGAQHAVAEAAMIWFERPAIERGVVMRLPADTALDAEAVSRGLRTLDASYAVDVVPVDRLFQVPPGEDGVRVVDPAPHSPDASLGGVAPQVDDARDRVGGYGGTVGDDDAGQSLEASLLLATGTTTPDAERDAYVRRVTEQLGALADTIHAPAEFRITLTSRSSTIPLNITNDGEEPVDVRIELDSSRLEFPRGTEIQTTLQPGVTRVDVRVETRTSGAFPLDITITSPDGAIELDRTTFDVRSTTVSGVGLVLSIGAGLFLVVWWTRHWRSSRRSRHLAPGEPARAAHPDDPGGGDEAAAAPGDKEYRPAHLARPPAGQR